MRGPYDLMRRSQSKISVTKTFSLFTMIIFAHTGNTCVQYDTSIVTLSLLINYCLWQ